MAKSYCLKHQAGNARDHFKKHHTNVVFEPADQPEQVGSLPRPNGELSASQAFRVYSTEGKSVTIKGNAGGAGGKTGLHAEPINPTAEGKSKTISASYAYKGDGESSIKSECFPDNPAKQTSNYVAEPVNPSEGGKAHTIKAQYYKNSVANFVSNGGFDASGVAEPLNVTEDGKSQTIKATYNFTSIPNICCYSSTYGSTGVAKQTEQKPSEQFEGNGKDLDAMKRVYQVRNGKIMIKGKEYPIKLKDGFYIIRKLSVAECRRLQTIPDWYIFPVSDTQAYKMLGNGWTVEVIKHLLSHIPGITSEDVEVLSMYDGMSCGQIALKELGAHVVKYTAYEIDKYAIQTTQANFPNTIQRGDAFGVREEDWKI